MPKKIKVEEQVEATPVEPVVEIKKEKSIAELQEMVNNHPFQWSNDFKVVKVENVYCVCKEGQLIMWDKDINKCRKIANTFNASSRKATGNVSRSDATL